MKLETTNNSHVTLQLVMYLKIRTTGFLLDKNGDNSSIIKLYMVFIQEVKKVHVWVTDTIHPHRHSSYAEVNLQLRTHYARANLARFFASTHRHICIFLAVDDKFGKLSRTVVSHII